MAERVGKPLDQRVVERLTGGDLMQWQADVGPVPHHVGGLLVLATAAPLAPDELAAVLAVRLARLPQLRRRPVKPALGGGGWYWLDDDQDPLQHLTMTTVPETGTHALLEAAVRAVTTPAPPGRSPWTATVLTGPDGTAAGVVLVLHHVLADGVSGLALLGALTDAADRPGTGTGPERIGATRPAGRPVNYADLVRDTWHRRAETLRRLLNPRHARRALLDGRTELGGGTPAPRSVLNRLTGPRRELHATEVDEAAVRAAAHRLGASVNDLVLVAVVEALRAAAADAGEELHHLVVSVPVAARTTIRRTKDAADAVEAAGGRPRNAVGVMTIPVPATGVLTERVRTVTGHRRAQLAGVHGQSLPLVLLAFRVVRTLHLVRWFLDRQRLVNTFLSAVPPTPGPISVAGTPVTAVVPLVINQGNTTAAFATTRHAGRLAIAVTTDPDTGPDAGLLLERLSRTLTELTALPATDESLDIGGPSRRRTG